MNHVIPTGNPFHEMETTDNKHVILADSSIVITNSNISNVDTKVQDKTFKSSFVILPQLNLGYDCILGMPYYLDSVIKLFAHHQVEIIYTSRVNVSSSNESNTSNVASSLNRQTILDELKSNSIKRRQNWVKHG